MRVRSMGTALTKFGLALLAACMFAGAVSAAEHADEGHGGGVNWQDWKPGHNVKSTASLQRGLAGFVNYCSGCHSLKYVRWSRVAEDLDISPDVFADQILLPGADINDYMVSSFPKADAENWFGREPPDLSLVARSRGTDWVFQFLKGFYADPSKPTGTNNLVLDGASMPAVLSDLEGVKAAVFAEHESGGSSHGGRGVERFEMLAQGSLTAAEYDAFVRDMVNFLDYASDPSQVARRAIGLWVVLFLMVFTGFAWFLKKEYWKDVH